MNKLSENDRQDINILIGLGQSILENEKKLARLEANFEKENEEYQNTLAALKSTLTLEENIYARMNLTPNRIVNILLELGDPLDTTNFHKQLSTLISFNSKELCTTRIVNTLFKKIIYGKDIHLNNLMGCYAINSMTGKTKQINPENFLKVEDAIKSDIYYSILTFLEKENTKSSNYELRKLLIERKYNLAFINPDIEKNFIAQNFEVSELYLTGKAYATINTVNPKMYSSILFKLTKCLFDISTNKLANMNINDMIKNEDIATVNILKAILKTCLLLDDNNFAETLKEQIDIQIKFMHRPITKGLQTILDIIDNMDEEQKLAKVITLNLKRES